MATPFNNPLPALPSHTNASTSEVAKNAVEKMHDKKHFVEIVAASCKYIISSALVSFVMGWTLPSASAKDLNVLTRVGYAAFLADDSSALCASLRQRFSADDQTAFRDAKDYAQWIKQRITSGLADDDARLVLTSAADRARGETREAIRTFRSESEVSKWCTDNVVALVKHVIGTFVRNRERMEEIILNARKD